MTSAHPVPSIPDHSVLRMIGKGAYGEIWLARGLTGVFRAVKVVYRGNFESERSFAREFEGMASFEPVSRDHDGFVDILHVGKAETFFYYIMELADDDGTGRPLGAEAAEGEIEKYKPRTLKTELDRRKQLPIGECLEMGISLAEALEDLHSHELTHRDIKPANIILVEGRPKLADIGLVASAGQRSYVGTEGYVPQEGPGTPAADVYSLGKVLYEMAMGKDRMDFPELGTTLDRHPEKARVLALNQVLLRACALEPRERYKHAREMHADLVALHGGRGMRKRPGLMWWLVFLAPVLAVAVMALWVPRGRPWGGALAGERLIDLRIATEPAGAMVILGDRMEKSPAVFESVEAGSYPLRIMLPGYDPIEARVDTHAPPERFALRRSMGGLDVTVAPAGVADYELMDGATVVRKGELPSTLDGLPTGQYHLVARRGGRTVSRVVEVERERRTPVAMAFETGEVEIGSEPPGADIYVGEQWKGRTPLTLELAAGEYEIRARYKEWPESRQTVEVRAGRNGPVTFAFPTGSVKITSAPGGAAVMHNGQTLGRTPLMIEDVEAGPVSYELRLAGYQPAEVTGTVAPREQAFLATRLEMKRGPEPGKPWENSLGMRFVPAAGIYIAIWDTRVADYDAFCAHTGRVSPRADFPQTPADPVVLVSWMDAEDFCKWLTQKEVREGVLEEGQYYRLPIDTEWSAADGLPPESGATPEKRDGKMHGIYPWGTAWPPPAGSGNFADRSARRAEKTIEGYRDGWPQTSPVGSFPPNKLGLYDMSGNVWQWVEDGYRGGAVNTRDWGVLRGGSWGTSSKSELESCYRNVVDRADRDVIYGFRCVLVGE